VVVKEVSSPVTRIRRCSTRAVCDADTASGRDVTKDAAVFALSLVLAVLLDALADEASTMTLEITVNRLITTIENECQREPLLE
jgi:hypothetical protein